MSEAAEWLSVARDHLTEALLVSAYDLHHKLLPEVDQLLSSDHWTTLYAAPQLLVVDSGGYELGPAWDGNEVYREPKVPLAFAREDYHALVARLPRDRDVLVVTYDHVPPDTEYPQYSDQVAEAQVLLNLHPQFMLDVLLKPELGARFIDPPALAPVAPSLASVHVIGVTEKELGDSVVDRLVAVARLRQVLDKAGVTAPLHVFGELNFLHAGLYYMAGAEIFDGLDWLRYGHYRGLTVHRETAALLNGVIDQPAGIRHGLVTLDYLNGLAALKRQLRSWVETEGDFTVMGPWAETYETTHAAMLARLQKKG